MNLAETHQLLTVIAAVDNRNFDDATVTTWRQILAEQQFDDCYAAAVDHLRDDPDTYLMPGHIHRRATALARIRAGRRRAVQLARQREIEAAETVDRSAEVAELVDALARRMGTGDLTVLRRREWVEHERDQQRQRTAEPNPNYDPQRAAELARRESA